MPFAAYYVVAESENGPPTSEGSRGSLCQRVLGKLQEDRRIYKGGLDTQRDEL